MIITAEKGNLKFKTCKTCKSFRNTPMTRVGSGFRDQMLAVKSRKNVRKSRVLCTKISQSVSAQLKGKAEIYIIYKKKSIYIFFLLLFTVSVWSRKPEPTLVLGVLHVKQSFITSSLHLNYHRSPRNNHY